MSFGLVQKRSQQKAQHSHNPKQGIKANEEAFGCEECRSADKGKTSMFWIDGQGSVCQIKWRNETQWTWDIAAEKKNRGRSDKKEDTSGMCCWQKGDGCQIATNKEDEDLVHKQANNNERILDWSQCKKNEWSWQVQLMPPCVADGNQRRNSGCVPMPAHFSRKFEIEEKMNFQCVGKCLWVGSVGVCCHVKKEVVHWPQRKQQWFEGACLPCGEKRRKEWVSNEQPVCHGLCIGRHVLPPICGRRRSGTPWREGVLQLQKAFPCKGMEQKECTWQCTWKSICETITDVELWFEWAKSQSNEPNDHGDDQRASQQQSTRTNGWGHWWQSPLSLANAPCERAICLWRSGVVATLQTVEQQGCHCSTNLHLTQSSMIWITKWSTSPKECVGSAAVTANIHRWRSTRDVSAPEGSLKQTSHCHRNLQKIQQPLQLASLLAQVLTISNELICYHNRTDLLHVHPTDMLNCTVLIARSLAQDLRIESASVGNRKKSVF